ncbi:hypothetical protein ASD31_03770 [Rhizobium sp. Root482]|nr:hypothetical protein ASD31_03770 [Rhizobium sp. Root482]
MGLFYATEFHGDSHAAWAEAEPIDLFRLVYFAWLRCVGRLTGICRRTVLLLFAIANGGQDRDHVMILCRWNLGAFTVARSATVRQRLISGDGTARAVVGEGLKTDPAHST